MERSPFLILLKTSFTTFILTRYWVLITVLSKYKGAEKEERSLERERRVSASADQAEIEREIFRARVYKILEREQAQGIKSRASAQSERKECNQRASGRQRDREENLRKSAQRERKRRASERSLERAHRASASASAKKEGEIGRFVFRARV